jgi:hypothetical protein
MTDKQFEKKIRDRLKQVFDAIKRHQRKTAIKAIQDSGGEVTEERIAELTQIGEIRVR